MNICKNCKHCYTSIITFGMQFAECRHPSNYKTNIVTGKKIPIYQFCITQRSGPGNIEPFDCGEKGKYFEQKDEKVSLFKMLCNYLKNSKIRAGMY